ncbi:MAG TPA: cytochrome c oxidase subunit II [Gammaproteobacteria bacterium]|nr:cytochrome c oxidase subunit II [Gammaproteobacteria bacterium]
MPIKQAAQFTLFSLFLASKTAFASSSFNMTEGVTPLSHDIYHLHMTIFWICVAIGIGVFSVMIYSILFHRQSLGAKPAHFHEHFWLEITWTIVPFLILVAMAIPATRVLIHLHDFSEPDLSVKVTGYQWRWRYEYLDSGIKFFSNNATSLAEIQGKVPKNAAYLREVDHPLVVPIHKKIRFLITSNDVIHGWWVPDLGVKQDAIPGFINAAWTRINRAGIYHGQCSKLCGLNHGYMPIVVVAMPEKDFDTWVMTQKGIALPALPAKPAISPEPAATPAPLLPATAKKLTLPELMKKGETVYMNMCATCHKPDGSGAPPVFPSMQKSKIALGPVANHIDIVLHGKPGTAMQAFKDQYTDEELAAVITYERNAFGNNTNTLVQPAEITAAKQKG